MVSLSHSFFFLSHLFSTHEFLCLPLLLPSISILSVYFLNFLIEGCISQRFLTCFWLTLSFSASLIAIMVSYCRWALFPNLVQRPSVQLILDTSYPWAIRSQHFSSLYAHSALYVCRFKSHRCHLIRPGTIVLNFPPLLQCLSNIPTYLLWLYTDCARLYIRITMANLLFRVIIVNLDVQKYILWENKIGL